jgi:hypothetical protein
MKINRVALLIIFSCITSCSDSKTNWKTIELGRYLLDVPQGFNFKYHRGIDSEGGEITNDTIKLTTDFGYYTDTLFQTPQEYLNTHRFVFDAQNQFMTNGVTYTNKDSPKIDVLSIRPSTVKDSDKAGFFSGADYIATCRHNNKIFSWPVRLPNDIKRHTIQIDNFNHLYRRIALPKKEFMGETAIYMREKQSLSTPISNPYGIVIGGDSLSSKQQALVLKIFKTLRPKVKDDKASQ